MAVKSVVPAIRALLAKELMETFGINQTEAANLLGITQTAVSKYIHNVRGSRIEIENEERVAEQARQTAADRSSLQILIDKAVKAGADETTLQLLSDEAAKIGANWMTLQPLIDEAVSSGTDLRTLLPLIDEAMRTGVEPTSWKMSWMSLPWF